MEDTIWAPLSAYILSQLFGSNIISGIEFAKEILPGTDFIPVAILAWTLKYKYPDSQASKFLGLTPFILNLKETNESKIETKNDF